MSVYLRGKTPSVGLMDDTEGRDGGIPVSYSLPSLQNYFAFFGLSKFVWAVIT